MVVMVIKGVGLKVICRELMVFMGDWMAFGSIFAFIIGEKFE